MRRPPILRPCSPACREAPATTTFPSIPCWKRPAARHQALFAAAQYLAAGLDKLSPEQYRSIHFNPDSASGARRTCPSARTAADRIQPAIGGRDVSTVETASPTTCGDARHVRERALDSAYRGKVSLPLSGFRLKGQINSRRSGTNSWCSRERAIFVPLPSTAVRSVGPASPSNGRAVGRGIPAFTHSGSSAPTRARNRS